MRDEVFELQARFEDRHWWFVARRTILHAIIETLVPPETGGSVIDVGCGTGGNLQHLGGRYRLIGLEPAARAIAIARQRFPEAELLEGQDATLLAGRGDAWTVFLLADVLEHVADDFRVLSELVAIMPEGSHLLLTVPAEEALWSPHDIALCHYRRYEPDRLRQVWHGLPVRERFLTPFNARLYLLVRLRRALARWRGVSTGSMGTDLGISFATANFMLTRVFAGERVRILRALASGGGPAFRRGVSLLAVLQRLPGAVTPRDRPPGIAPDRHVAGVS